MDHSGNSVDSRDKGSSQRAWGPADTWLSHKQINTGRSSNRRIEAAENRAGEVGSGNTRWTEEISGDTKWMLADLQSALNLNFKLPESLQDQGNDLNDPWTRSAAEETERIVQKRDWK